MLHACVSIYKFLFIQFNSFFYIDLWHFQTFNRTFFIFQYFSIKKYLHITLLYDFSELYIHIISIVRDLFITIQTIPQTIYRNYYSYSIFDEIQVSPDETMRVSNANNVPLNNCRCLLLIHCGNIKTAASDDFPAFFLNKDECPPLLSSKPFTIVNRL